MRPPVYIAGPFRGTPGEVLNNVVRACRLGCHAAHQGLTPLVPHAMGFLSVYEPSEGREQRAIDCCLAMVHHLADVDGAQMWVILRDDGTPSAGTALELEAWDGAEPVCRTWAEWQAAIAKREAA